MADNSSIPVAIGNETFANKDIAGVKYPRHIQVDGTGAEVVPATEVTLADVKTAVEALAALIAGGALNVFIDPSSVNANGQGTMANSAPVVLASDQSPVSINDQYSQYETVAASQTAQTLGATGATGDYLAGVLVFPGTAGCGVVTILDNATTIGTFAGGGTTALPSLVPFLIPVGLVSVSGAWKITTGANVTAVGIGKFT